MYLPPHFSTDDPEALHQLMRAHPLGAPITNGSQELDANHLLFEFAKETGGHGVLRAHVARNNSRWQKVRDGDDVLVIFKAADAYISPNYYPIRASMCITSRCLPGTTTWYMLTATSKFVMMLVLSAIYWPI